MGSAVSIFSDRVCIGSGGLSCWDHERWSPSADVHTFEAKSRNNPVAIHLPAVLPRAYATAPSAKSKACGVTGVFVHTIDRQQAYCNLCAEFPTVGIFICVCCCIKGGRQPRPRFSDRHPSSRKVSRKVFAVVLNAMIGPTAPPSSSSCRRR